MRWLERPRRCPRARFAWRGRTPPARRTHQHSSSHARARRRRRRRPRLFTRSIGPYLASAAARTQAPIDRLADDEAVLHACVHALLSVDGSVPHTYTLFAAAQARARGTSSLVLSARRDFISACMHGSFSRRAS